MTTEYTDGIDAQRVVTLRGAHSQAQHDAFLSAMQAWTHAHNEAQAWTFDGCVAPAEKFWRAHPEGRSDGPYSPATYRREILSKIDWLRRLVRGGLAPGGMTLEEAIVWAVGLGQTIEEARWRLGRGDDVRKARKARAEQRRAIESAAALKREASTRTNADLRSAVQRHLAEHPGDSNSAIARALLRQHGRRSGNRVSDHEALRKRVQRLRAGK